MNENALWLKFIISGKVNDYLAYKSVKSKEGDKTEVLNRCTCNKGEQYKG